MTISIPRVDAYYLGTLIALFERAVSFYASFVNINAYHQPGVEAGKKAAGAFLETLQSVKNHLAANSGKSFSAAEVAAATGGDQEETFHILTHLAANAGNICSTLGDSPAEDQFTYS
jgi:glucose-6-phosphate isomerase